MHRKRKETLNIKSVKMIEPVTGWFEITQCSKKKDTKITNLAETTYMVKHPWPVDIMHDQGGRFLGHEF